jgi:epoxyqueuosine reductase QueG
MTDIGTDVIDRDSITRFFHDRTIDEYAVVSGSSLHAPEGRRPCDLLPSARTMIVFGAEMDEDLFSGTPDEISEKVRRFETKIRNVADDLIFALQSEGFEALPVRSIVLQDGTIKGLLSLNHCAAEAGLGEIGDNRLLISPRFGSRLGLGAVVTSRDLEETPRLESTGEVCTHCNRCIRACPEHALSPGEIDMFRCRNVTGSVPGFLRPVVFRFIRSGERIPFSDRLLNLLASRKVNTCAECLTACPYFHTRRSNQDL